MDIGHLDVLHDHYKESFSHIREREKQRDMFFLFIIGIFGLLFLEIQYPAHLVKLIDEIKTAGVSFKINTLPIPIITSVSWTVFGTLMLRYCQGCITVDRQYDYLHQIEDVISSILGSASTYRREGEAYNNNYPVFSKWTYIFYVFIFPFIVIILQVYLMILEINSNIKYFFVYDCIMAAGVTISLVLYRGVTVLNCLSSKK